MDTAFSEVADAPGRASPLPPDDRRAMIIGAVIPLLLEHGSSLTTRQIAEGVGVAEGTLFRAFGDKETLITAAIDAFFDPAPLHASLRAIDPQLSLEDTTEAIIGAVRDRLSGVFRMMAATGGRSHKPTQRDREAFTRLIGDVLAPHAHELGWPVDRAAHAVRLISFAASVPEINAGVEVSARELAALVLHGLTSPLEQTKD